MILYMDLPVALRQIMMIITYLFMFLTVFCILCFIKNRNIIYAVISASAFFCGYGALQMMMSVARRNVLKLVYVGFEKQITECPLLLIMILLSVMLVFTLFSLVKVINTIRKNKKEIKPKFGDLKVKIHDTFGLSLVASKAYYSGHKIDRKTVKLLYEQSEECFKNEKIFSCRSYGSIYQIGSLIGVRLSVKGDLPKEEKVKPVVCAALSECIVNTYRHAWGDTVFVDVLHNDETEIVIKNNGKQPAGTVTERGGLKHLRSFAESNGIKMTVQSKPQFSLTLTIPREVQNGI